MVARIYRPAKTAMSSGQAKAQRWVLEYEPERPKTIEPLMGYTSSDDMKSQIRLEFASREAAIAYAERNGIAHQVFEPKDRQRAAVSYSDNFRRDRNQPWTH
jgi:ETC complex I subunit conserved region